MIDGSEIAEALREPFHFDHRLSHKNQSGKQELRWNALSPTRCHGPEPSAWEKADPPSRNGFFASFHIRKVNICRHSSAQTIVVAGQTNLHAKYLFDAVRDSLHIAWRKFGLPIDLLDYAIEIGVRKRIDANADVLA